MSESPITEAAGSDSIEQESPFWYFMAVELALLVASSNFLLLNEQSILQLDSGIAVGAIAVTGAAISGLYFWRNRYWRAALQGAFVFLAIDLIGNDLRIAAIISAVVFGFTIIKNRSLLAIASVFLSAMLATSLLGMGTVAPFKVARVKNQGPPDPNKPAILHLILDEHVGIEGLHDPGAVANETRSRLRRAYVDMGFRVYDRAYSEHLHTVNALPSSVNFGLASRYRGGKGGVRVDQNRYFDYLRQAGFRINVWQTAFANFCTDSNFVSCVTYNQQSMGAVQRYTINDFDRAKIIYFKILDQSEALLNASYYIDRAAFRMDVPQSTLKRKSRTNTLSGLASFDDLIVKLKDAQSGEVRFAHILLPHTPYLVQSDCRPRPFAAWDDRDSQSSLEVRERLYLDQVWCAAQKVREAIDALERSPAAKNYVVIVHGDHGSRLTKTDPDMLNRGKFDSNDMIAGFSTFFAIKGAGLAAGVERQPASVGTLLGQFTASDFKVAPSPSATSDAKVYLDDENWKPSGRSNMPKAWMLPPGPGNSND